MFEAFTDPNAFFRERADDSSLGRPFLIVLTVGLVGLVGVLYQWQFVRAATPSNAGAIVSAVIGVSAVWAVIQPVLGWVVFALFYYGLSGLFDGDGSYRDVLALAGYGYLPRIVGAVVALALSVAAPRSGSPAAMANDPILLVSSVLSWVFVAWQGFVTTYAVKHARSIDLRHAAISVWVPVGLYLLFLVGVFAVSRLLMGGVTP